MVLRNLILSTITLFLFTNLISAQNISVIEGAEVAYSATTGDSKLYDKVSDCTLMVQGGKSLYTIAKDAPGGEKSPRLVTLPSGEMQINIKPKLKANRLFYLDRNAGELTARLHIFDESFNVVEDIPNFNWQLTGEQKTIAGYTCHQATGSHRGRNFTAWFTQEIPINAGPWKFQGLPGLILEVNDQEGKYNWYCKGIKPLSATASQAIVPPGKKKELTFDEYYDLVADKLKEKFDKLASNPNITISGEFSMDGGLERTKE